MKKSSMISKTLVQIVVYLFELLSVSFAITYVTHVYLEPLLSYIDLIERMLTAYTIYQILVIVILTNINDIAKDCYLAYATTLKMGLLYLETRDEKIKVAMIDRIDKLMDPAKFNSPNVWNAYVSLKQNLDVITKTQIEMELITAEHCCESATLNWRYSFLLRLPIFK